MLPFSILSIWSLSSMLAACISPDPAAPPSCSIAEVKWDAASQGTSYDHATTAELLRRLSVAAEADRAAFAAGQPTGASLGALALETQTSSPPLVSAELYELALRLRQLDCAVQRGSYARQPQTADKLYSQILTEARKLR